MASAENSGTRCFDELRLADEIVDGEVVGGEDEDRGSRCTASRLEYGDGRVQGEEGDGERTAVANDDAAASSIAKQSAPC
jgi:hypothetical protein